MDQTLAWLAFLLGLPAIIVAGLLTPVFFRMRERERLYDLLKQAQDLDRPMSPELVKQIVARERPTRDKDLRRGAICLAIGVGIAVSVPFSLRLTDDPEHVMGVIPIACVLGALGVAFLGLGLSRRPDKD